MTITSRPTCLSALTATALLLALLTALSFAPGRGGGKAPIQQRANRPRESDGGAERSPGQPHLERVDRHDRHRRRLSRLSATPPRSRRRRARATPVPA